MEIYLLKSNNHYSKQDRKVPSSDKTKILSLMDLSRPLKLKDLMDTSRPYFMINRGRPSSCPLNYPSSAPISQEYLQDHYRVHSTGRNFLVSENTWQSIRYPDGLGCAIVGTEMSDGSRIYSSQYKLYYLPSDTHPSPLILDSSVKMGKRIQGNRYEAKYYVNIINDKCIVYVCGDGRLMKIDVKEIREYYNRPVKDGEQFELKYLLCSDVDTICSHSYANSPISHMYYLTISDNILRRIQLTETKDGMAVSGPPISSSNGWDRSGEYNNAYKLVAVNKNIVVGLFFLDSPVCKHAMVAYSHGLRILAKIIIEENNEIIAMELIFPRVSKLNKKYTIIITGTKKSNYGLYLHYRNSLCTLKPPADPIVENTIILFSISLLAGDDSKNTLAVCLVHKVGGVKGFPGIFELMI